MTEPAAPRGDDQGQDDSRDELRRHAEESDEGTDTPETGSADVPREHSEDPAEG